MEAEVARRSEGVIERLRAKGEAPPLKEDGYFIKRGSLRILDSTSTAAPLTPAAAGGAAAGAGSHASS